MPQNKSFLYYLLYLIILRDFGTEDNLAYGMHGLASVSVSRRFRGFVSRRFRRWAQMAGYPPTCFAPQISQMGADSGLSTDLFCPADFADGRRRRVIRCLVRCICLLPRGWVAGVSRWGLARGMPFLFIQH